MVPTFGDYLANVLDAHDWSADQLARALNVDRSLVYRWRRNERAPKLDTDYIRRIADLLELTPTESETLEEARIRTLREFNLVRERAQEGRGRGAVERLLTFTPTACLAERSFPVEARSYLPEGDGAIEGLEESFLAAVELLETVPPPSTEDASIIMVTAETYIARTEREREMLDRWQLAQRGAMRRGWHITSLWRLERDPERTTQLIERMLCLIGDSRFHPRYFRRYGQARPAVDSFLIPGVASFSRLSTEDPAVPRDALILREPGVLRLVHAHLRGMLSLTNPLAESFPSYESPDSWHLSLQWDDHNEGRRLVKGDLSFFTEPSSWSRPDSAWARSRTYAVSDLDDILEARSRRLEKFRANVEHHTYRSILPRHAVRHRLATGRYLDDMDPRADLVLPMRDRVEQIRNFIDLMKTYKNYEVALVDDQEAEALHIEATTQWAAMESGRAIIATRALGVTGHPERVDLVIDEPTVGPAFSQYFNNQWENIAPEHRDKAAIIRWLEAQLADVAVERS